MDQLIQALRALQVTLDIGARMSRVAADAGNAVVLAWNALVIGTHNLSGGAFTADPVIGIYATDVRYLAYAALAPMTMWALYRVMFGHGMFTQYTARIMLPRIVIATAAVGFALQVFQAVIDLDNALCQEIVAMRPEQQDVVTMVVGWTQDVTPEPGLAPLVSFLVLGGFVVLGIVFVVRYAVLVLLAILAPLAAVLMVLPETQHYAKAWISLFVTTVFMQPLQLFILTVALSLEAREHTIIRHGFALAALWMCFKVPGALHSASTIGGHAQTLAKHQGDRLLKVALKAARGVEVAAA